MIKNICVYCSSSSSLEEKFYKFSEAIGEKIAREGYNLVYGGSKVGTMGVLANAAIKNGAEVTGVIPKKIYEKGLLNPELADTIITANMRERKAAMEELADAFIAIPGGFGTFDEIFEIIVEKQLGYHKKAIVFIDLDGFYAPLFQMFENIYKFNFAKEDTRELYHIANSIEEAFNYLANYKQTEYTMKW